MTSNIRVNQFAPRSDRWILFVLLTFLLFEILNGLLRFVFATYGVPWLIYLPKATVVATVLGVLAIAILRGRLTRSLSVILLLVCLWSSIALYYTENFSQTAFGIFVLLPLMLGVIVEPVLYRFRSRILGLSVLLWWLAAFGVIYSYFVDTPWTGFGYQIAGTEIVSARQWHTFEIERLAGFSRASYLVASHLVFLAIPIVMLSRLRMLKVLIWIATGVLVALTTTKKAFGVYVFLSMVIPAMGIVSPPGKRLMTMLTPWIMLAIGIALPASTFFINYDLNLVGDWAQFIFSSFEERLTWTWPEGFDLLLQHGNPILGRGIGGVGAAQIYFEPELYVFADSLYLYLYIVFGIAVMPITMLYAYKISQLDTIGSSWDRTVWYWVIAIMMYGWVSNVIEGATTSLLLGVGIACANRRNIGARTETGGFEGLTRMALGKSRPAVDR